MPRSIPRPSITHSPFWVFAHEYRNPLRRPGLCRLGIVPAVLQAGGFARSKYIQDNIAVPADMIQAQFGKNFQIENGKVVAVGADGQKIYSRTRPGEVADFDEALESLVGGYQHKDSILKGGQGSGGGFQGNGGNKSGPKSLAECKTKDEKIAYMKQVGEQA